MTIKLHRHYPNLFHGEFFSLAMFLMLTLPYFLHTYYDLPIAIGTISMFIICFIYFFSVFKHTFIKALEKYNIIPGLILFIVIFSHSFFIFFIVGGDLARSLYSLIIFSIFILSSYLIVFIFDAINNSKIERTLNYVFLLLSLIPVFAFFEFNWTHDNKDILLFSEPSHFALIYIPLLFYMLVTVDYKYKLFLIAYTLLFLSIWPNLTFFIGVCIGLVFLIPIRYFYIAIFFVLMPIGTFLIKFNCSFKATCMNYYNYYIEFLPSYYLDRIFLSFDSMNLSSIVFLVGWEKAYLNFKYTYGWGIGFQQFGVINFEGFLENIYLDRFSLQEPLNKLDGASLAPKLIGELGFIGLIIVAVFSLFFVSTIRSLSISSLAKGRKNSKNIFFQSIFAASFLDIFIRGTGYFNPPILLLLSASFWLFLSKSIQNHYSLRYKSFW